MEFGWYGDADARAAAGHLMAGSGVDPTRIGVLGLSMGGEEAIGAAAGVPGIRAVVAEGATARTAEDKAGWLPGGVAGALQRGIDRLTYAFVDLLTSASPPIALRDAVRAAEDTRFLLVTAGTMPDETRAAEVLQEAAPDRVEVWEVPDAAHTGGLRADPDGWEQRVVGFFDKVLADS
jgi:dienelactone hydrolase